MAASVALFDAGRVLLIARARPPYKGYWTFPGGRALPGETAQDCARREVLEELALVVDTMVPVTVMAPAPGFQLHVFAALLPNAQVSPSQEVADWQLVNASEPDVSPLTPGLEEVIDAASDHRVLSGLE